MEQAVKRSKDAIPSPLVTCDHCAVVTCRVTSTLKVSVLRGGFPPEISSVGMDAFLGWKTICDIYAYYSTHSKDPTCTS